MLEVDVPEDSGNPGWRNAGRHGHCAKVVRGTPSGMEGGLEHGADVAGGILPLPVRATADDGGSTGGGSGRPAGRRTPAPTAAPPEWGSRVTSARIRSSTPRAASRSLQRSHSIPGPRRG